MASTFKYGMWVACPIEPYRDGYHTTRAQAVLLRGSLKGFRITLLGLGGLEIVMETFQDETTLAEIVGRLDDAGYYDKLVEAGRRPVVVFHPSFGSSLA